MPSPEEVEGLGQIAPIEEIVLPQGHVAADAYRQHFTGDGGLTIIMAAVLLQRAVMAVAKDPGCLIHYPGLHVWVCEYTQVFKRQGMSDAAWAEYVARVFLERQLERKLAERKLNPPFDVVH